MKLMLIKIGKAFHTIQRDGFVAGGRRIMEAFLALFGRVKGGDVLFVTGGVGDSARYRTKHVSEELDLHGIKCSVTVQDNPFLPKYADKFKVFIFHRVLYTGSVIGMIEKIKEKKREIIFETDDLVFDPKYLKHMDFFKKMNRLEKKLYENGVGGEILKDDYVKVCTTSTDYLADKLRETGKKVFLVSNKLPESDLLIAEDIVKNNSANRYFSKENIVIGYFSGAHGHDKDFSTVENSLIALMKKFDNLRIFLGGPLEISEKFDGFTERIKKISYVPRKENYMNIAGIDINIAPLELGNPFCESKSELKFFEAGIMKVPTVAVANQTFSKAIEDGMDGFLASNEDEWTAKLEKLIVDADLRKNMGENAYNKAVRDYTNRNSKNEEYYNYLRGIINAGN